MWKEMFAYLNSALKMCGYYPHELIGGPNRLIRGCKRGLPVGAPSFGPNSQSACSICIKFC